MPNMKFPGLKIYAKDIQRLYNNSEKHIKKAVYAGADIVADSVRAELAGVRYTSDKMALKYAIEKTPANISYKQKQGLLDSLGLAPMKNEGGEINTKLGFDGYNDVQTKKYPKGQPNALIARSLESGSSAMLKQPFMRRGTSKAKKPAEKAMAKTLDEEIQKIMK